MTTQNGSAVKRSSFIFVMLAFILTACKTSYIKESILPPGSALYQDNFSKSTSGWGEMSNEAGTASYADKTYRIVVNQPNVNLWSHPGLDFANVHVDVSVFAAGGPLENRMGLICRLVDDQNFYFFAISADGYYGIGKMKDGQASILTGDGKMLPNSAIQTGNVPNRLRGTCVDDLLNMYINDSLVGSAQDGDFSTGDVGILAGSFSQTGADVYFDNFFVYKP